MPIKHRGQRWYQMEFEVGDLEERGLLISARKNPRGWKSLNKAIEFAEATFPVTVLHITTTPNTASKTKVRHRPTKTA